MALKGDERIERLDPERRRRVEERAAELIAEEMSLWESRWAAAVTKAADSGAFPIDTNHTSRSARPTLPISQLKHRIGHPALKALVVHELLEELGVVLHQRGHHPPQRPIVLNPCVLLV